ncbi:hypothetical protein D9M72_566710 [compost metagenome]
MTSIDVPTGVVKPTCVSPRSALGTNSVPISGTSAKLPKNVTAAMIAVASRCFSAQPSIAA